MTRIFHRSLNTHGLEHGDEEMYAFVESSGQKEDELAPEEDLLMESWQELSQGSIFGSGGLVLDLDPVVFKDAIWQGAI